MGALLPRTTVDALFNFSATIGTDYSGAWADDSTFTITVGDGAGSDLHRELVAGDLLVNVLGDIHNQGCRPCGTGRYAYAECRPWDLSAPSGVGV